MREILPELLSQIAGYTKEKIWVENEWVSSVWYEPKVQTLILKWHICFKLCKNQGKKGLKVR